MMLLRIYVEDERNSYVLYPLSYSAVRITNTHRRQMTKIEVVDEKEGIEKSIDCRGVPRSFDHVMFHADWTPEVFVAENESYKYDSEKNEWLRRKICSI